MHTCAHKTTLTKNIFPAGVTSPLFLSNSIKRSYDLNFSASVSKHRSCLDECSVTGAGIDSTSDARNLSFVVRLLCFWGRWDCYDFS